MTYLKIINLNMYSMDNTEKRTKMVVYDSFSLDSLISSYEGK